MPPAVALGISGVASAVGSIYGAKKASDAAKGASETQVRASQDAMRQQEQLWQQMQGLQQPFIQPGQQAASTLGRLLTPGMGYRPGEAMRPPPERPIFGQPGQFAPPTPPLSQQFNYGPQANTIADAYQQYLGRRPSELEIGSQLGYGQAIRPQNVNYAIGNIQNSPEAQAYRARIGGGEPPLPPSPGGGFGGPSRGPFGIPRFARGGFVDRPTLAMVGEEGPEAIVPLNRRGGDMMSPYDATVNDMVQQMGGRRGGFGGPDTPLPSRPIPFDPGPGGYATGQDWMSGQQRPISAGFGGFIGAGGGGVMMPSQMMPPQGYQSQGPMGPPMGGPPPPLRPPPFRQTMAWPPNVSGEMAYAPGPLGPPGPPMPYGSPQQPSVGRQMGTYAPGLGGGGFRGAGSMFGGPGPYGAPPTAGNPMMNMMAFDPRFGPRQY